MKKANRVKTAVALALCVSLLAGCAAAGGSEEEQRTAQSEAAEAASGDTAEAAPGGQSDAGGGQSDAGGGQGDAGGGQGSADGQKASGTAETLQASNWSSEQLFAGQRPVLLTQQESSEEHIAPCAEPYVIAPDLGNVENLGQFYLQDGEAQKLAQNGFVVAGSAGSEFFEIYEANRYSQIPNFVTVDSLLHTYHLYFARLLKNIEKDSLSDALLKLGNRMLENSRAQYEQLSGGQWESAARRNLAYFAVGVRLLDEDAETDACVEQTVSAELDRIEAAAGIELCSITGDEEDYSQYIPRGYYEGDEQLERYFKAMMWYGRIHFIQKEEDLDRSALLITKALSEDSEALALWKTVYAVTSFFAGESDDNGVCEYAPLLEEVYGRNLPLEELDEREEDFARFHALTAELPVPKINSVPIFDGEDNVIPGFRFMGQRFTIDAAVMQQLIYSRVQENDRGEKRMLPDVLDVPAAFGSDLALRILEEGGAAEYEGYTENMEKLRSALTEESEALWPSSLYSGWLATLRPLLEEKGEGYPVFMRSEEWSKKNLECFAGSFTELKHDTVLYSKQVMAEMGGGYEEEIDDRGYVEPEPCVYERFAALSEQTAQGLSQLGLLSGEEQENLSRLTAMAGQLLTISNKELTQAALTEEEYEFIRSYGGYIEHFWYEAAREAAGSEDVTSQEYQAAIVVDIATDPNGVVLEAATGNPSCIYVVVRVDGKIKLAKGSVYSFYQFPWPLEDRLTDSKWRQMMGLQVDDEGIYNYDNVMDQPEWTQSYRYRYEWE